MVSVVLSLMPRILFEIAPVSFQLDVWSEVCIWGSRLFMDSTYLCFSVHNKLLADCMWNSIVTALFRRSNTTGNSFGEFGMSQH